MNLLSCSLSYHPLSLTLSLSPLHFRFLISCFWELIKILCVDVAAHTRPHILGANT